MVSLQIEELLVSEIFAVLFVFARIGAGFMVMPGFGESYVSARARLLLALAFSLVVAPLVSPSLPEIPGTPLMLGVLLLGEIIVGLAIGLVARFLIATLALTGSIISYQASLALATQFDISQQGQGTILGNFFSITAVVLLFTLDLHYVMIRGLADSYTLFLPGMFPPVEDFANYFAHLVSAIFEVAVKLSAPNIVVGLLLYFGAGILARLMPNMQVFFVILPAQIVLSFFIILAVFTSIMLNFTEFFSQTYGSFLTPGL
jgi:flagellar biosynthetic protein FliR